MLFADFFSALAMLPCRNERPLAILSLFFQAGHLLHEQKIADLLADLEETKSAYRAKREAARAAEGAARKTKRELGASRAVRCGAARLACSWTLVYLFVLFVAPSLPGAWPPIVVPIRLPTVCLLRRTKADSRPVPCRRFKVTSRASRASATTRDIRHASMVCFLQ